MLLWARKPRPHWVLVGVGVRKPDPTAGGTTLFFVEGGEAMPKEKVADWLGMAMHRKNPRRVLSALRLLMQA
ncbi:DUF7680 family protein [Prochlorothrix hollandica]|uniref:DUF7680 domain-containing protein n=1 Tax=Prochlorothrix hollandica PCC 9006 = CALU 1027 TaxID=317619 RepID=A0A0M2Q0L8_PROHO|nr:hypothetical protein PROH_10790 [Prochlorothrix hollandica PCC 9006 = CALU 1027]